MINLLGQGEVVAQVEMAYVDQEVEEARYKGWNADTFPSCYNVDAQMLRDCSHLWEAKKGEVEFVRLAMAS